MFTRTPLARILAGTLLAAAAVLVAGFVLERARFGVSDDEAFRRLERLAQAQVTRTSEALRDVTARLAARPDLLDAAAADRGRAAPLFEAAAAAVAAQTETDISVTVYGPAGQPLAWSGRPSELPPERIAGPAAEFLAPGPLGLRLIYLEPVADGRGGRRLAGIAAERLLSTRARVVDPVGNRFTLVTPLAPVLLRTRYEGAGEALGPDSFEIRSPSGDLLLAAEVSRTALAAARAAFRSRLEGALLLVFATAAFLMAALLFQWRARQRRSSRWTAGTLGILAVLLAAWALARLGVGAAWDLEPVFTFDAGLRPVLPGLFRVSPDFLLNGLFTMAAVLLGFDAVERARRDWRRRRRCVTASFRNHLRFDLVQAAASACALAAVVVYQAWLRRTFAAGTLEMLHPSVYPWDPLRIALAAGLLAFHVALFWFGVVLLRLALAGWRMSRDVGAAVRLWTIWLLPLALAYGFGRAFGWPVLWEPVLTEHVAMLVVTFILPRAAARYRHASQGFRIVLLFVALVVPAVVAYPALAQVEDLATRRVIETMHGPQVLNQLEDLQTRVLRSLEQLDALDSLPDLVQAAPPPPQGTAPPVDAAFQVWAQTDLAAYRLASAVELYGPDGSMVSRFAFNLPEYGGSEQTSHEAGCDWDLFGEVSRFVSEERRLLHAGRGICLPARAAPGTVPRMVGAIVVHVLPDYAALPFIWSQSPYVHLFGRPEAGRQLHRDVEFMVYGWGHMPLYATGQTAWPLGDDIFKRAYASRAPFWTSLTAGGQHYEVYVLNDRAGIYALGYGATGALDHLVHLAEIVTLGGLLFVGLVAGMTLAAAATGHRPASARALLREVRESFYRKLFLAFVAVSIIPVLALAFVARAYMANRLLNDAQEAARRTAAVAQRVIEDYRAAVEAGADPAGRRPGVTPPAQRGAGAGALSRLYDDVMVWLSLVIDQDVNIYDSARLVATSERDLFASGFLPTRVPADVYRAIALQRLPGFVSEEQIGEIQYLLAAAPVGTGDVGGILTVPQTLRQQEIERNIDDLNRRIVLAALLFILFGAGIGYVMAERIGDPVNRLTRATRRIARGELNARIAATSSDELRRLVEAFNQMAAELERQRGELERTHRLEAWAEMARQVAHEIKNPLTPIQLSAEHLRRVHQDRGQPLAPVLDDCVGSILSQVRLLRQIASEFSSFAVVPVPRPSLTVVGDLVKEVLQPYRSGVEGRITIDLDVPATLPRLMIDRTLVGRALTNMIDNALHAMSGPGRLSIAAREAGVAGRRNVTISIADTGIGMDREALTRLFEPYFSTKAVGTGLGLAIAKRNIELNGGTIAVESEKDRGTTVTVTLPVPEP